MDYQSIQFNQGEGYADSSVAGKLASEEAQLQNQLPSTSKNNLKGSSKALNKCSPLTEQGRFFDIALTREFIIVNVHAESNDVTGSGMRQRDKQFRIIIFEIIRILDNDLKLYKETGGNVLEYVERKVYLCGDLNTQVGASEERILNKHFVDTNASNEKFSTCKWQGKNVNDPSRTIRYYDRILEFKRDGGENGEEDGKRGGNDSSNGSSDGSGRYQEWKSIDFNQSVNEGTPHFDHKAVSVKVKL